MSFFDKLFGKKKDVEVVRHKSPTEFLKNVHVTSIANEFKPAQSGKIVLFEDSETWSAIMKKALEDEGYNVVAYTNANNAVENIKEHKPDLVLMDVNMPGMSGHEATKIIKTKASNRDLPIIILTSANTSKDRMDAMKVGARTFLTKDQPLEDLICAIKAYMTNTALKSDISQVIQINKIQKQQ